MAKPEIFTGKEIVDQFEHHNLHTQGLIALHPDLKVHSDGKHVDYYAESVNALVDEFILNKETLSTYVYLHFANPFKKIRVPCHKCDGLIRVNSIPSKIPLFIEHEGTFRDDYMIYSCVYEELIKNNNFSAKTLSEIQLYILKHIQEYNKSGISKPKVDLYYLNNSIKRLLPFT
jgi:hypothetical protein